MQGYGGWNIEITLLTVTALHTLADYSLNDTAVIFDHINDIMCKPDILSLLKVVNNSVNVLLSRSIMTLLRFFKCFGSFCFCWFDNSRFFNFLAFGGIIGIYAQF
ncbi:hypothetical protein [Desulfopila aestuarii]|uniref:hypothetical protein n=1 Tax=Desulfopila aestuarii TaxID=231440 RepID=UPI000A03D4B7